jgi:hypothetical protein
MRAILSEKSVNVCYFDSDLVGIVSEEMLTSVLSGSTYVVLRLGIGG